MRLCVSRVAALAALGDDPLVGDRARSDAVATQLRAVDLAPRSVPVCPGLAALEERAREVEAMRTTAGEAMGLALVGSAAAYGLLLAQRVPLLRLLAEVQLAVIGNTLLPFEPADGPVLGRSWPGVVAGFGVMVVVAGVLFALGLL